MNAMFYSLVLFWATKTIAQSYNEINDLLEDVFNATRYNRHLRPLKNQSDVVEVNITQYLTTIDYFDISSGELHVTGYFELRWKDELVRWDPSKYGGKSVISVPAEKIWKPEVVIYSSSGNQDPLIDKDGGFAPIWISFQGSVVVVPAGVYKTKCNVDTTLFPFDKHTCFFVFILPYLASELSLYSPTGTLDIALTIENGEWEIEDTMATVDFVNEKNKEVVFPFSRHTFTLKRRPSFVMVNAFPALAMVAILNSLTCFIPPGSGERLSFAVTLYLALALGSAALIERLPNNSLNMPYVSYWILIINVINTAGVCWSIFIVNLVRTQNLCMSLPRIVKKFVMKRLKRKAQRTNKVSPVSKASTALESLDDDMTTQDKPKADIEQKSSITETWNNADGNEVAEVLDKLYFVLTFAVLFVVNVVFIAVMHMYIVHWETNL